jgi:hypothetical protein
MARYERFEDLPVWRTAAELFNRVLDLFEQPNLPLSVSFRNQLERAALSVSNNIAEGFERMTTHELAASLRLPAVQPPRCARWWRWSRTGQS